MIEGVPQSEEPRALLFGFTLSFSLGAILEKHVGKKKNDQEDAHDERRPITGSKHVVIRLKLSTQFAYYSF